MMLSTNRLFVHALSSFDPRELQLHYRARTDMRRYHFQFYIGFSLHIMASVIYLDVNNLCPMKLNELIIKKLTALL